MKKIFQILLTMLVLGSFISCEPIENRESLPEINKTPSTLNFSVTVDAVNKNVVHLVNNDADVIPYWSYTDALGNELGHFNTNKVDVSIPFAGTYYIKYTGYTRGGAVAADAKKVVIAQNDLNSFSDPKWGYLTNGVQGKTWVINFVTESPFAFVGSGYINKTVEGDWAWWPGSYNDVSWSGVENKDWGQVTFDLNGGYNVSVTQTSKDTGSTTKTTKKGTFTFQRTDNSYNDRIILNGAIEMLHTNAYYKETMSGFSYSDVRLIELTPTSLRYAIIRNDGVQVVMNLIPKS